MEFMPFQLPLAIMLFMPFMLFMPKPMPLLKPKPIGPAMPFINMGLFPIMPALAAFAFGSSVVASVLFAMVCEALLPRRSVSSFCGAMEP